MSCILIAQGRIGNVKKVLTQNNITIITLSVASDNAEKDKNGEFKTEWTDFEAFGKRADGIFNYFHKGDMVNIVAKKSTSKVPDSEGKNRYYTHYKIESIEMLSRKKVADTSESSEAPESIENVNEEEIETEEAIPDINLGESNSSDNKVPLKDVMEDDIPY